MECEVILTTGRGGATDAWIGLGPSVSFGTTKLSTVESLLGVNSAEFKGGLDKGPPNVIHDCHRLGLEPRILGGEKQRDTVLNGIWVGKFSQSQSLEVD